MTEPPRAALRDLDAVTCGRHRYIAADEQVQFQSGRVNDPEKGVPPLLRAPPERR